MGSVALLVRWRCVNKTLVTLIAPSSDDESDTIYHRMQPVNFMRVGLVMRGHRYFYAARRHKIIPCVLGEFMSTYLFDFIVLVPSSDITT